MKWAKAVILKPLLTEFTLSFKQQHEFVWSRNKCREDKVYDMSRHANSGQNQNIRIANESFEKVAKFKYLGTTLTNQDGIHDEIKSRLNSGNACYYYSDQIFCFPVSYQKT
jgi:hypothetical protein